MEYPVAQYRPAHGELPFSTLDLLPFRAFGFPIRAHAPHDVLQPGKSVREQKAGSNAALVAAAANHGQRRTLVKLVQIAGKFCQWDVPGTLNVSGIPFSGGAHVEHLWCIAALERVFEVTHSIGKAAAFP